LADFELHDGDINGLVPAGKPLRALDLKQTG
jgi:hypothetical protein